MNDMTRLLFISLFFYQSVTAQSTEAGAKIYYKQVIQFLSNDSLQGRPCCSEFEREAAEYIAKDMFYTGHSKVKFQKFTTEPKDSVKQCTSKNVYSFFNNGSKRTIVIGAHYDHIGWGGALSKSIGKRAIHPGADDNASGVALLLSLMKSYERWRNTNYNYLFVTYSAHEVGLFGSTAFEKMATKKFKTISMVLNFDMVGRMSETERWLVVYGGKEYPELEKMFPENGEAVRCRLEDSTRLIQLDTKSYTQKNIPCLSFTTGLHDDYHKVSDTEKEINYDGIYAIQNKLEQFLNTIELYSISIQK